eukprot:TRINITY_DN8572_c0_g1_i1.p2 TRINITY_DN8572_c0_g1~~TRINITY_DN8572_c0_g1_i1.p2  ORF type:complete len:63 (+),score=12.82 TRINITY_DN8572_c0_g1_i1:67-255(+)
MAVPWHSDFYACTAGFFGNWWPTSRPDHVIPREEYDISGPDSIGYDMDRLKFGGTPLGGLIP